MTAIVVSSAFFGLVHLNPWQFITGFIIGILSRWVYYRTRNLMPSIIIHFCANLSAFTAAMYYRGEVTFHDTLETMYGSFTNLIVVVLGCAVLVYSLINLLDGKFEKDAVG